MLEYADESFPPKLLAQQSNEGKIAMKNHVTIFLVLLLVVFKGGGATNDPLETSMNIGQITCRVADVNVDLDKESAVKIAEIIFAKTYGKDCCVAGHEPYIAVETEKTWIIRGTLKQSKSTEEQQVIGGRILKVATLGGAPEIEIRKSDCHILHLTHYK